MNGMTGNKQSSLLQSFILRPLAAGTQLWSGPVDASLINDNIIKSNAPPTGDGDYVLASADNGDNGVSQSWSLDWADQPVSNSSPGALNSRCNAIKKIVAWVYSGFSVISSTCFVSIGIGGSTTSLLALSPNPGTGLSWSRVEFYLNTGWSSANASKFVFRNLISGSGATAPLVNVNPSIGKTGDYKMYALYVEIFGDL